MGALRRKESRRHSSCVCHHPVADGHDHYGGGASGLRRNVWLRCLARSMGVGSKGAEWIRTRSCRNGRTRAFCRRALGAFLADNHAMSGFTERPSDMHYQHEPVEQGDAYVCGGQ
jgi:hypothetical protein